MGMKYTAATTHAIEPDNDIQTKTAPYLYASGGNDITVIADTRETHKDMATGIWKWTEKFMLQKI